MRAPYPYPLTSEEAARLVAVLARHGGTRTLRDLYRRHSFWDARHLEQAAASGIIRIERRKPAIGRPSVVAVLNSEGVNNCPPAKLPRRADLHLGLTWKEERFLARFAFRWGTSYFGEGKNGGCATNAYAVAFGRSRKTSRASDRASASRLLRRPWIKAGFLLDRRLMSFGGRTHWPTDLRSAADDWIGLLQILDRLWSPWPLDVASAIRRARTYPEAIGGLRDLAFTRAATVALGGQLAKKWPLFHPDGSGVVDIRRVWAALLDGGVGVSVELYQDESTNQIQARQRTTIIGPTVYRAVLELLGFDWINRKLSGEEVKPSHQEISDLVDNILDRRAPYFLRSNPDEPLLSTSRC